MGYNPFAYINLVSWLIFFYSFFLLVDYIVYRGLSVILKKEKIPFGTKFILSAHWIIALCLLVAFIVFYLAEKIPCDSFSTNRNYSLLVALFILSYLPKTFFSIFIIIDIIVTILTSLFIKLRLKRIKRLKLFESKHLFIKSGSIVCILLFLIILQGILINKQNVVVVRQEIYITNLPPSFENYRIVQFSDLHLGSLYNPHIVKKTIRLINSAKPDIIVFTGDMVNLVAKEAEPYIKYFQELDKDTPKFSILGNHDYGDYAYCYSVSQRKTEKGNLVAIEQKMGFRVFLNSGVILKKGKDSIALAGVENWGSTPYKKYGDLPDALKNVQNIRPVILLSHDPIHWTTKIAQYADVDLTLSGHTHGMQMGIKIGNFAWSPAKYKYYNWNGLFHSGWKQIYVNRGVGFLVFPGRIGMRPEITLIILKRK